MPQGDGHLDHAATLPGAAHPLVLSGSVKYDGSILVTVANPFYSDLIYLFDVKAMEKCMRRQFVWISGWLLLFIFWLPLSWAETGWQPLAQTIHKSDSDPRQYQAIKLDNGMTVLLVSDAQATKSLASLALPVGSLDDPASQLGLAHYLEHMVLMGSKRYPQPEALSEFLKSTAAATMPAPRLTARRIIWKWKMMRCNRRLTVWRTPSPRLCSIRSTPTANGTR